MGKKPTDDGYITLGVVRVTLWNDQKYPDEADLMDTSANVVARIRIDRTKPEDPKLVYLTTPPGDFSEQTYRQIMAAMQTRRPSTSCESSPQRGAYHHGGSAGANGGRGGGRGYR